MPRTRHVLLAVTAALAAFAVDAGDGGPRLFGAASAERGRYEIRIQRPSKVGDVHRESIKVQKVQRSVMRIAGKTKKRAQNRTVELVAEVRVKAVDRYGRTISSELRIERFVATERGRSEVVVEPGRVLTVTRGDPPVLSLDQGTLSERARDDVKLALSTRPPKTISDDEVFGTKRRQPVGGSWPIDAALAAKGLSDETLSVEPSGLSGRTKLVAVRQEQGVKCLEVSGRYRAKGLKMHKLPPGAAVERSDLRMEVTSLLPVDTTKQPMSQRSHNKAEITMKMKVNGHPVSVDLYMEETKEATRSPLQ